MCDFLCINNSSLTLALTKDYCFVSAFPGFFVFGHITQHSYEELKFFQISHYNLPNFYAIILKIVHFMAGKVKSIEKTKFLSKKIKLDDVEYYIYASCVDDQKLITFQLQTLLGKNEFEICLTVPEFHNLLNCVESVVMSCLCLKSNEIELVNYAILQPLEDIIKCQNKKDALNFVKDFYKDKICLQTINNLSTVLNHYNSIIVILHKFQSLHFNDELLQNTIFSIITNNEVIEPQ